MLIATTRCSSASSRLNLARIVPKTWHSRRFAVAAYLRNAAPSVVPEIKPYYITTPIFYPNAVPHIGHLYSLIIADTYARYARLVSPSRPVNFVTGTDEHGMKIQKAAQERDMVPQELCDLLGLAFQDLARRAKITHTKFVRTSEESHHHGVQTLWHRLAKAGYIYKGKHSGWYSISDEAFFTDAQIRSHIDPNTGAEVKVSVETGNVVEWTEEENYKFKLSAFKDRLKDHFEKHPRAIYPPHQMKEVMDILSPTDSASLPDLSISRPSSRLTWGIPVPGDASQTIYVWLDALASYLTGIGYPWSDVPVMRASGWPADLQVIGKDILRFHAIYFPAFLMALDIPPPKQLLSHAHWTVNKAKMSKSVGNVVDPIAILKEHGVDNVRWYFARVGGNFKSDVDWNDDQLLKSETELRTVLGNIFLRLQSRKIIGRLPPGFDEVPLHRGILMTRGNAQLSLTEPGSRPYDEMREDEIFRAVQWVENEELHYVEDYLAGRNEMVERPRARGVSYSNISNDALDEAPIVSSELRDSLDILRGKVCFHMQRLEVTEATQSIVNVLSLLNKEITCIEPWASNTGAREILHLLVWARETLRICGILLQPFLPIASQSLLDALRVAGNARTYDAARIGAGRVRAGPMQHRILFPNAEQRKWEAVEADHQHDANVKMKKNAKERSQSFVRHQAPERPSLNKLYQSLELGKRLEK